MKILSKQCWDIIISKFFQNLVSVKVWIIAATFVFCFYVAHYAILSKAWDVIGSLSTLLTGVLSVIVLMREGFKMSINKKNKSDSRDDDNTSVNI
jgi:hypothetical protein